MKPFLFTTSTTGYTLVLGLGETGLAAAHWYLSQGLTVRIADTRESTLAQVQALRHQYPTIAIEAVLGDLALDHTVLDQIETIILSPGLALSHPPVARLLSQAQQQGIAVMNEIELFARALKDLSQQNYTPKVIAITGTNGKTTVTQMLKHMVVDSGFSAVAAGNISPAAIAALQQAIEQQRLPDFWIIELSSFQLAYTHSLPIDVGTVLNISQDHIDWHGSMQAYTQAKGQLFAMSAIAVVNRDDEQTGFLAEGHPAVRSFGLGVPPLVHDLGLQEHQGQPWICTPNALNVDSMDYLLPAASLLVVGQHNLSNALAALTLAHAVGLEWAALLGTLRTYHGEPHRCQFIRNVKEVAFINDSKGTNVGATVAAIEGLHRSLVLIVGGVAKGQDFTPLATVLKNSVCRGVVLIGQDAQLIARTLVTTELPLIFVSTLTEAVEQAFDLAQAGDAVLLSPACASLDMFSNYIERGDKFIGAITDLALDQGEVA